MGGQVARFRRRARFPREWTLLILVGTALGLARSDLNAETGGDATGIGMDISGPARVIDGDTIDIAGERIRLDGIDAPEMDQTCSPDRRRVGDLARRRLAIIAHGRTVRCARRGVDRYGRTLAACRVGETDVAADLVRAGWAWDYTRFSGGRFAALERQARFEGLGVWALACEPPWAWRRQRLEVAF